MSYTNEAKVENYLTIDIDNSFASVISDWASAVDNYIDNYTGRSFGTVTEDRYFDGNNKKVLDVDNFVTMNTVEILEYNTTDTEYILTEGKDEDYIIYPYNETPKYRLILSNVADVGSWLSGRKRIKLNADWGYSDVPKDIELAATMLLAGIVEKGLKGGSVSNESIGDYSVSFKKVDDISSVMGVKEILQKYKEYKL